MGERPAADASDPLVLYDRLIAKRSEYMTLRSAAVDQNVAGLVDRGIETVNSQITELVSDPTFVDTVVGQIDTAATALEQIGTLRGVLPEPEVDTASAPYVDTARRGLEVAADLGLTEANAERMRELMTRLGEISMNGEAIIDEGLSDSIVSSLQIAKESPKPSEPEPNLRPAPATPKRRDVEDDFNVVERVPIDSERFIQEHMPERDSLMLAVFLKNATTILQAQHIPLLETASLEKIIESYAHTLTDDDLGLNGRDFEEVCKKVLDRFVGYANDSKTLEILIEHLSADDLRLELINYFYISLDATYRRAVKNVAQQHAALLARSIATHMPAHDTSAIDQAEEALSLEAEDQPPEADPKEISAEDDEWQRPIIERIGLVNDKLRRGSLRRDRAYSIDALARGMGMAQATVFSTIADAKRMLGEEGGTPKESYTVQEFMRLYLMVQGGEATRPYLDALPDLIHKHLVFPSGRRHQRL